MTHCTQSDAAQTIAATLADFAQEKTMVLLSGGSSAQVGVESLRRLAAEARANCTVLLADERYVPYDTADSNAKLLKDLGVMNCANQFIETVQPSALDRRATAELFEQNLQSAMDSNNHIVAVLGVGPDNHTAGILPNTEAATSQAALVVDYQTELFERISIAPAFFENIDYAYVYAAGHDKLLAVAAIEEQHDAISHPSQLIKNAKQYNILFNEENI